MSETYDAALEIRGAIQSLAEELNAYRLDQAQDYLDHTPYTRGQSVYVSFNGEGQGAVRGTVTGASPAGLILDHVVTVQGLFYPGLVQVPWASIALVATGQPTLECPWLEAAPED